VATGRASSRSTSLNVLCLPLRDCRAWPGLVGGNVIRFCALSRPDHPNRARSEAYRRCFQGHLRPKGFVNGRHNNGKGDKRHVDR